MGPLRLGNGSSNSEQMLWVGHTTPRKGGRAPQNEVPFPMARGVCQVSERYIELVGQPVDQNRRNVFVLYFDNLLVYFILLVLCCTDTV